MVFVSALACASTELALVAGDEPNGTAVAWCLSLVSLRPAPLRGILVPPVGNDDAAIDLIVADSESPEFPGVTDQLTHGGVENVDGVEVQHRLPTWGLLFPRGRSGIAVGAGFHHVDHDSRNLDGEVHLLVYVIIIRIEVTRRFRSMDDELHHQDAANDVMGGVKTESLETLGNRLHDVVLLVVCEPAESSAAPMTHDLDNRGNKLRTA